MSESYTPLPKAQHGTAEHPGSSNDHSPDVTQLTPSSNGDNSPIEREDFEHNFELQELPDPADESSVSVIGDIEDDTKDGDVNSPAIGGMVETKQLFTPAEERRLVRKLDQRLVLFMAFLYMLSFLDRSNIGNARIAGMSRDLNLSESQWSWLLEGFYITYILFEWMVLLYNVVSPHVYISLCVLSWGIIASLQSVATGFPLMMILRLLLGLSEAAFSPGVPFYLSFFYRREELAFRTGIMIAAAPLAISFAGSLAWLITWLGEDGPIAPWRMLFLVEGFPSVFVAVIAWYNVPDSPETAPFLDTRQRRIASLRLKDTVTFGEVHGHTSLTNKSMKKAGHGHLNFAEIFAALKDPKCYLTALMFFNCNVAFASLPVFLPTVIRDMGYSELWSQALSAPPYLVAFGIVLFTAYISDRTKSRGTLVCLHALLGFTGYSLCALGGVFKWGNLVRYFCVYPAAAGFFSAITLIITWTINNQESNSSKGTGMTILNLIGQCGPILGTRLYPDSDAPYFVRGMTVCSGAMLIVFFLSLLLRTVLARENRKRASALQLEMENEDETQLLSGEKSGKFMYIL